MGGCVVLWLTILPTLLYIARGQDVILQNSTDGFQHAVSGNSTSQPSSTIPNLPRAGPMPYADAIFGPPFIAVQTLERDVSFSCSVTNVQSFTQLLFDYSPSWASSSVPIYNSANDVTYDKDNFTVVPVVDPKYWQLIVKTVKPQLATQYECTIQTDNKRFFADLVALDPIECRDSELLLNEGAVANMSCSVNYFKNALLDKKPHLTWYKNGNAENAAVAVDESSNRTTLILNRTVTAKDDGQEFNCHFAFPDSTPPYEDNCTTILYVTHLVSEITFEPPSSSDKPATVYVGDVINCTADGRPYPTIVWYTELMDELVRDGELTVTQEMTLEPQPLSYICVANNTIDGKNFSSVERNYTFNAVIGSEGQSASTAAVEPWVIAVAVIVPIIVIAIIVIVIVVCVQQRKKKKTNEKKTTNGTTNAPRPATTAAYSSVPTGEIAYSTPSRPPPAAPTTTNNAMREGSVSSYRGPPGPDNRNGSGQSPGFGDLGIQTYGANSNPVPNSVHGSNSTLGTAGPVSMNPNPGYPVRGSNQALNASNARPTYPYNGSNSALNNSLTMNPNTGVGRQPSIASSSARSHASSYNAPLPSGEMSTNPNDLSSMHGSEV